MNTHSKDLVVKSLAVATGKELKDLSIIALKIQDTVAELIAAKMLTPNNDINKIQDLDYLTQSLVAMAEFWGNLANDTPDHWQYSNHNAIDKVPLKSLANRLCGFDENDHNPIMYTDGACDFF